jgi:hypothetical protein
MAGAASANKTKGKEAAELIFIVVLSLSDTARTTAPIRGLRSDTSLPAWYAMQSAIDVSAERRENDRWTRLPRAGNELARRALRASDGKHPN